jgi:exosome complex RNA-binding protein Rrp4
VTASVIFYTDLTMAHPNRFCHSVPYDSLLKPTHSLLARLAAHFPFEVAVGVNGFVWVRASKAKHVIAVGKVLEQADKVKGTEDSQQTTALQVTRNRGVLSAEQIASIVEPFK